MFLKFLFCSNQCFCFLSETLTYTSCGKDKGRICWPLSSTANFIKDVNGLQKQDKILVDGKEVSLELFLSGDYKVSDFFNFEQMLSYQAMRCGNY